MKRQWVGSVVFFLLLSACGGGSGTTPGSPSGNATTAGTDAQTPEEGGSGGSNPNNDNTASPGGTPQLPDGGGIQSDATLNPFSASAIYHVTVRNFWGAENYPQEFPDGAHLSLWGGATHNKQVSFWNPGEIVSRGMEDVAEAGLIDILLFDEVAPAIDNGTADSMIEVRRFTDPAINGEPGILEFDVVLQQTHPLLTMVSMLGPSPDWFVGVSGLSLKAEGSADQLAWLQRLTVPLPLYDGGSKSDIVPVMGGPDIIPPIPVALVAYDAATGVYLPSEVEQIVAELFIERIR